MNPTQTTALGAILFAFNVIGLAPAVHAETELLVRWKDDSLSAKNQNTLLSSIGVTKAESVAFAPWLQKVTLSAESDADAALYRLRQSDWISYAQKNTVIRIESVFEIALPDDKDISWQWAIHNDGKKRFNDSGNWVRGTAGVDIKLARLWEQMPEAKTAARNILVAVTDTGISLKHKDLAENIYKNPGESGPWAPKTPEEKANAAKNCLDLSCNGIDDDGNGLIDDVHGWNWAAKNGGNNQSEDDNGHGSHVAGVIGGRHNETGIAGVNDRVWLLPLKFLGKRGEGTLEGGISAIGYAVAMKADIINASWGSMEENPALEEAVRRATAQGVLFVAAAGNSSLNNDQVTTLPANVKDPGVISVVASTFHDQPAHFTNYGVRSTHLSAPGHLIYSSFKKNKHRLASGTSMAAPHVAGVAAMIMGLYPELRRKPAQVREWLMQTSDRLAPMIARTASGSRLNALNAALGTISPGHAQPTRTDWQSGGEFWMESEHPYTNATVIEREIHVPGAQWIRVKIGRMGIESGRDFLEIRDSNGALIDAHSGFSRGLVTRAVAGDRLTIRFVSDAVVTGWGFEVVGYETLMGTR